MTNTTTVDDKMSTPQEEGTPTSGTADANMTETTIDKTESSDISPELAAYRREVRMRPNFGQSHRAYRAMIAKRKRVQAEEEAEEMEYLAHRAMLRRLKRAEADREHVEQSYDKGVDRQRRIDALRRSGGEY